MVTSDSLHPHQTGVKIRNTSGEDIPKIVNLQRESFPYLACYGNVWHPDELQSHLHEFPEGQFVAVEPDGTIVGSASTLIVLIQSMQNTHGKTLLQMVSLRIIILGETACMVPTYQHIQNIDMKALGVCYMIQERNWSLD